MPGMPGTRYFTAERSEELLGREMTIQAGGSVGGGSAINGMMYSRPAASDYDDWERCYDNPGWGFESLRPLFQKLETYELETGDKSIHGYSGPMHVSHGNEMSEAARQWLESALAWDKDRPDAACDINDFRTANAYGRWQKWISGDGLRQDAGHRFLYPAVQALGSNVTLCVLCKVDRVIFEGKRAVGVAYSEPTSDNVSITKVARARKLVVLSAGAFASPAILERSGIGSPSILSDAGIPVRVHLDGIGENYQDHDFTFSQYAIEGVEDDHKASPVDLNIAGGLVQEVKTAKEGSLNGIDVGAKLRPTAAVRETLGEAFAKDWDYFANAPDKPVIQLFTMTGPSADAFLPAGVPPGNYLTATGFSMYPAGRGSVHVRSRDPHDPPRIVSGHLTSQADVAVLMWHYKVSREIARRMPCYRGEAVTTHPSFAPAGAAACTASGTPVAVDAPDIVYTAEDDAALETWIRQTVTSTWHAIGTCAMKPLAKRGVVDSRLNVYGVEGLKVADLSICPANVSANTSSTALVIGEKAAVIIGEDLGILNV